MHPDTQQMADHMGEFGLYVVGQSLQHAIFSEGGNPYIHAIAAVQAAHGAELIIKARIAQEHPLLIFSTLPKPPAGDAERLLDVEELMTKGRTATYFELPDLLWAATGYRVPQLERYVEFGKLRNMLQHLLRPSNAELSDRTLEYVFTVVEPMVQDFWGDSCADSAYLDPYSEDNQLYLKDRLDRLSIANNLKC